MRYVLAMVAAVGLLNIQGLSGAQGSQALTEVRRLYDAGRFGEAIAAAERVDTAQSSRFRFIAASSQEKLNNIDAARQSYRRLAEGNDPAWAAIGNTALAVLDKRLDAAMGSANEAVKRGDSLPEAHYERGLVLMLRRDYDEAAAEFEKATSLDPSFAGAHYYAGLANYRARHVDRMASHFETFLKLAPNAPERPEVESIMRTLRGR